MKSNVDIPDGGKDLKPCIAGSCLYWLAIGFGLFCSTIQCQSQGTIETRIAFDSPPLAPGTSVFIQQYFESDMWFRPLGVVEPGNGFGRHGGAVATSPENGTTYLKAALGDSLMFSFTSTMTFDLVSVDLAEYSTIAPFANVVRVVGYRHDGTVVFRDIALDGVIDGTGPLEDFETVTFDKNFSDLDRVEIPTYGWSLDNLVVFVPEPGVFPLLALGALGFISLYFRRPRGT